MSFSTQAARIRNRRERRLGWVILASGAVVAALCVWSWIETFYNKRQLFDLYFSETVQGLSVGADVICDGQKIGQVESVRLRSLSAERTKQNYVVVTIYADFRSLWSLRETQKKGDSLHELLRRQIQYGLRTRLFMRSLISNGLCVEVFFSPETPAVLVDDPERNNFELPTVSKTLSQHIDKINELFEKYKLRELATKMREAQSQIGKLNAQITSVDFSALNETILRKTKSLKETFEPTKFLQELASVNNALKAFSDALERGQENSDLLFDDVNRRLEQLSGSLRQIRENLPQKEQIDDNALLRLRTDLEAYRQTLKRYTEELRKIVQ